MQPQKADMATDNSSAEERNTPPSPSSRPGNTLQAAATMNAGLQHENSRGVFAAGRPADPVLFKQG